MKLLFIPVWLLTKTLRPLLPADHAWKPRAPTLGDWARNGTREALLFSVVMWETIIGAAVVLVMKLC